MKTVSLVLAAVAGAAPLSAQAPDRWQPIREAIQKQLVEVNGAAMAVAVAHQGRIVWEQGFGWANREKMIPATQHTMFSLASISKPITATGLMVLAQRGKIDLDRPTNEYLGAGKLMGLAGDAAGATVRRVLNHTAGLPLHYQFFYANEDRRPPTMDETIARYGILVSAPGERFQYSNLGYGIIDYLISRVSGQPYREFMRQEVFLPLGLTRTSIDIGPGLEEFVAERYDRKGRPVPFYTFDHPGGSAVYSSAHDLVRFGMFHLKNHLTDQRAILTDSTINLMQTAATTGAFGDSTTGYALGWSDHRNEHGYRMVEHTGGMPGVLTALNLFPTENIAIVALTNGGGNPFGIAEDIAAVLLPKYAASLKAERAKAKTPPAAAKFVPGPELVGTWEGTLKTWQKALPFRLTVEPDGDVKVRIGPPPAPPGVPDDEDTQLEALLNDVSWERPAFRGNFAGTIPTPDASWTPHAIALDLRLVGDKLRGQASAQTPDRPVYFSIASYLELRRRR